MSPARLSAIFLTAARCGDEKKMQSCLEQGAAVDHADNLALGLAAKNGHTEIVALLLEHGADAKDSQAIQWAAQDNRGDVVRLLLEHGASFDDIPKALQTRFRTDWNRCQQEKTWEKCAQEHEKSLRRKTRHHHLRLFVKRHKKP